MEETNFNPELSLELNERALVAQTTFTQGWPIINRLLRSEVDKYIIKLINVSEDDEQAIVAAHRLSKAAAQIYTALMARIAHEVNVYVATVGRPTEPVDLTEGLIDMGALASTQADIEQEEFQSLYEGGDLNEQ